MSAKSSTVLLVHSWGTTAPNLGRSCTLLLIFAIGMMLQILPLAVSFIGDILNTRESGSGSSVNAVYYSTYVKCFGTSFMFGRRSGIECLGRLNTTRMCPMR